MILSTELLLLKKSGAQRRETQLHNTGEEEKERWGEFRGKRELWCTK